MWSKFQKVQGREFIEFDEFIYSLCKLLLTHMQHLSNHTILQISYVVVRRLNKISSYSTCSIWARNWESAKNPKRRSPKKKSLLCYTTCQVKELSWLSENKHRRHRYSPLTKRVSHNLTTTTKVHFKDFQSMSIVKLSSK